MVVERIESRGIRCLECRELDLQSAPEAAKNGFGRCKAGVAAFVTVLNSRNCRSFEPAPADVVAARDAWADAKVLWFWQRKR